MLPIVSDSAEYYDFDPAGAEDLPPHRAAIPVPLSVIQQQATTRRNNVIWLGIVFSLALHGGFFGGAVIWGQGGTLPDGTDRYPVAIRIQVAPGGGDGQAAAPKQGLLSAATPRQSGAYAAGQDIASAEDARPAEMRASPPEMAAQPLPAAAGPGGMAVEQGERPAATIPAEPEAEAATPSPQLAAAPEADAVAVAEAVTVAEAADAVTVAEARPAPAGHEPAPAAPSPLTDTRPDAATVAEAPPADAPAGQQPAGAAVSSPPLDARPGANAVAVAAAAPSDTAAAQQPAPAGAAVSSPPLDARPDADAVAVAETAPSDAPAGQQPAPAGAAVSSPLLDARPDANAVAVAATGPSDAPAGQHPALAETVVWSPLTDARPEADAVAVGEATPVDAPAAAHEPAPTEAAAPPLDTGPNSIMMTVAELTPAAPEADIAVGAPLAPEAATATEPRPSGEAPPIPQRAGESSANASLWPDGDGRLRGSRHSLASRGAVFGYKRRVRARVMAKLPRGSWASGRVVVGFRLSRSGAFLGGAVRRSSGNPAIDSIALNCVRNAGPYPRPPQGVTPAQLALSIDFRFE